LNYSSSPEPAPELTVQVVRSLEGVAELEGDFARLQAVTGNTLPFALFEWQLTWCRHFRRQDPAVVDEPMFHVVRDSAGNCVAIVPLILTRRRVGMFKCLLACWAPIRRSPKFALPGATRPRGAVANALNRSLPETASGIDTMVGNARRVLRGPGSAPGAEWLPAPPSYALDLLPTGRVSCRAEGNIRESLRHCFAP
jgi:hypothetical protein